MRIDVHAHYWTADYLDRLVDLGKADAGEARGLGAGDGAELEARLRLMDRAGIEMQVLSAAPQLPYGEDGKKAPMRARSRSAARSSALASAARRSKTPRRSPVSMTSTTSSRSISSARIVVRMTRSAASPFRP
jgi:hypothetical protein